METNTAKAFGCALIASGGLLLVLALGLLSVFSPEHGIKAGYRLRYDPVGGVEQWLLAPDGKLVASNVTAHTTVGDKIYVEHGPLRKGDPCSYLVIDTKTGVWDALKTDDRRLEVARAAIVANPRDKVKTACF